MCPSIFKSRLFVTKSVKWDIVHKDELFSIKAKNDLGLNVVYKLVCNAGLK
jgi:hypothetical protein